MPRPRGGAVSSRTGETNGSSSLNHTPRGWSWPPTLVDQFPGKAHTPRKGMENPPHRGLVSSTRIWRDRQGKAVPLTQSVYPGSELEYIGIFICTCVLLTACVVRQWTRCGRAQMLQSVMNTRRTTSHSTLSLCCVATPASSGLLPVLAVYVRCFDTVGWTSGTASGL